MRAGFFFCLILPCCPLKAACCMRVGCLSVFCLSGALRLRQAENWDKPALTERRQKHGFHEVYCYKHI